MGIEDIRSISVRFWYWVQLHCITLADESSADFVQWPFGQRDADMGKTTIDEETKNYCKRELNDFDWEKILSIINCFGSAMTA